MISLIYLKYKEFSKLTSNQKHILDDLLYPTQQSQRQPLNDSKLLRLGSADRFRKLILFLLISNRLKTSLAEKIQNLISKPFMPTSYFMIIWYIITILVIMINMLSLPLVDAFPIDFYYFECTNLAPVVVFQLCILIIDILLQLNVAEIKQGNLILDRKAIARIYIKKRFTSDLISLVGFLFAKYYIFFPGDCMIKPFSNISFLKYAFLLKIYRLRKIVILFKQEICSNKKSKNYLEIVDLLVLVLTVSHYIACIWVFVGKYSRIFFPNENWIVLQNSNDKPSYEIYLQSMYFACMTMTTVGYGDILPRNPFEYLTCICIMLISCGFFAYTLNTITSILQSIQNQKKSYLQEIEIMENYMRKRKIDSYLQQRVKNYLKCMYKSGLNDDVVQESALIQKLSQQLQQSMLLQDKGQIFDQIPEFRNYFTKNFLLKLIDLMEEIKLSPEETIQLSNELFIYVVRGTLNVVFELKTSNGQQKEQMKVFSLKQGEHLGLENIFGKECSINSYLQLKSEGFSVVYILQKTSIDQMMQTDKDQVDFEKFCQLRDQIKIYDEINALPQKCSLCNDIEHKISDCSLMFLCPERKQVIKKSEFSKIHKERTLYKRMNLKLIQSGAENFNLENQNFEDEEDDDKDMVEEKNHLQCVDVDTQSQQNLEEDLPQESNRSWMVEENPIEKNEVQNSVVKKAFNSCNVTFKIPVESHHQPMKISGFKQQSFNLKNSNLAVPVRSVKKSPSFEMIKEEQEATPNNINSVNKSQFFRLNEIQSPMSKQNMVITRREKKVIKNPVERTIINNTIIHQQRKTDKNESYVQRKQTSIQSNDQIKSLEDKLMDLIRNLDVNRMNSQSDLDTFTLNETFERGKEFVSYFAHNNLTIVIQDANKARLLRKKKSNQIHMKSKFKRKPLKIY